MFYIYRVMTNHYSQVYSRELHSNGCTEKLIKLNESRMAWSNKLMGL